MSIIFAFLYSLDHFLGRGIRHGMRLWHWQMTLSPLLYFR